LFSRVRFCGIFLCRDQDMTLSGRRYRMFIFQSLPEVRSVITYSDIQHAYDEMRRHNARVHDSLRREVKLLKKCYACSLSGESSALDMERLVRIERMTESGRYEECSPSCLGMNKDGVIEFRICTLINETPTGNMFVPAYITMEYCDDLIKIGMSLSNFRSDKRAELYVSKGEEAERYVEASEYIKSMMIRFIADQKFSG
ncbi:hypothetical protein ACN73K_005475, partial [Escherichia coli]